MLLAKNGYKNWHQCGLPHNELTGAGKGDIAPQYLPYEANLTHQYFGILSKIFGAKPQKFGAVGTVLDNFGKIFEKSGLKMQQNSYLAKNFRFSKLFPDIPHETSRKQFLGGIEKVLPLKH